MLSLFLSDRSRSSLLEGERGRIRRRVTILDWANGGRLWMPQAEGTPTLPFSLIRNGVFDLVWAISGPHESFSSQI